jgi:hypothetical protein
VLGILLACRSGAPVSGWTEQGQSPDRRTYRSPSGDEQATLSTLALTQTPTSTEFQLLCEHRLAAEREGLDGDLLVTPSDGGLSMFFSGGDRSTHRLFSGYLYVSGSTFHTVYVEGIGVSSSQHLASFQAFVESTRRRR